MAIGDQVCLIGFRSILNIAAREDGLSQGGEAQTNSFVPVS